VKKQF